MPNKSRPRTGSLQFRPRKRAKKETPSFRSIGKTSGKGKPQNFLGYKVGMLHVVAKDERQKSISFGQEIVLPATVIECPPLKVFGVRAYQKNEKGNGIFASLEITADKVDKHLGRKIRSYKKKHQKKGEKEIQKEKKEDVSPKSWGDLEKQKDQLVGVRLLVHTQPGLTNFGRKKPDVSEITLNGSIEEQLGFAKQKLGQPITIKEVFERGQMADIKAITKGKGFQGVIKRHNVKMLSHKAKKRRIVGSISPWHPATVMWTVARPGQLGYHARTEYNKKILEMGENGKNITPAAGFGHYGKVQNDFLIIAGSIPGPPKRCVALRNATRNVNPNAQKIGQIISYSTKPVKQKEIGAEDDAPKLEKVKVEKETKEATKSVAEELAEAGKQKQVKK
ncbi:50S ribosomal protein L3 [Candidatus Micrarchaeota archaeon]|nr:50S ribosomal protein L3 [Candidatus Micrarchaeota archaeon]MBU1930729.1 50S ribosomal protein L3 [Candidatus Micrarchaeota archaeon]